MDIQSQPGVTEEEAHAQHGVAPASEEANVVPNDPVDQDWDTFDDDDADARTLTITPGCVFGIILAVAALVAAVGGGLWLLGRQAGVGPFATTASSAPAGGQVSATTVATVNGEPITMQDLDTLVSINMAMTTLQGGQQMNLTQQQRQQARMELLNQAISNTLILQAARQAGLTVSEDQVQAEWLAWVRRTGLTPDQLDAELIRAGANREAFQEWLGEALVASQYLNQYVAQGAGPNERTQAYEEWIQQQMETASIQIYQGAAPVSGTN